MTDDPLKGLTKRQLEEMKEKIEAELRACLACGNIGALRLIARMPAPNRTEIALLICLPCLEKNRLPRGRAEA